MTEIEFWNFIEDAWDSAPELKVKRLKPLKEYGWVPNQLGYEFERTIKEKVFPRLRITIYKFSKSESFEFNRILEKYLYDLDRSNVQEYIEGGDDGFLYARGFVIGMGKQYYDLINVSPELGVHLESEDFAYVTRAIYHKLYDDENRLIFGVDRETGSNLEGWN